MPPDPQVDATGRPTGRPLYWLIGFQLLLVLPFLTQPMHMDDPIYVDIGRNVLETPAHAHDFPYCFEGGCVPDMGSHSHPPLVGYWIGLVLFLTGANAGPIVLHSAFLIFPLLFAVGMYRLSLRFSPLPALTAAVAIAGPAGAVMAHTLMADFPTLALWTFGTSLYIDGVDTARPARIWVSAVVLAGAAFASYPALAAAGLCWIYALLQGNRTRTAYLAPLAVMAFIAAWLGYSSLYFGRFVLAPTANYFLETHDSLGLTTLAGKAFGIIVLLVPTIAVPVSLIGFGTRWFEGRIAILWTMIAAALTQILAPEYGGGEKILVVGLASCGGWVLAGLVRHLWTLVPNGFGSRKNRDAVFLCAWAGTIAAIALSVYAVASARYLLPIVPPLVLLAFFHYPDARLAQLRLTAMASIALSCLVAVGMSVADLQAATATRDMVEELGDALDGWEEQVRFGGEWGFRFYMEQEGFRQFVSTSGDIGGGQFVVTPAEAVPYEVGQDTATMLVPVTERSQYTSFPLRLMDRGTHAGFYSSGWGLLPFSISAGPVESVTIRQVHDLVARLPDAEFSGEGGIGQVIPRPLPTGVGLFFPFPGTLGLRIDVPPAQVRFECLSVDEEVLETCPVRVFLEADDGTVEPLAIGAPEVTGEARYTTFTMDSGGSGRLSIAVAAPVGIANWTVAPPGLLP